MIGESRHNSHIFRLHPDFRKIDAVVGVPGQIHMAMGSSIDSNSIINVPNDDRGLGIGFGGENRKGCRLWFGNWLLKDCYTSLDDKTYGKAPLLYSTERKIESYYGATRRPKTIVSSASNLSSSSNSSKSSANIKISKKWKNSCCVHKPHGYPPRNEVSNNISIFNDPQQIFVDIVEVWVLMTEESHHEYSSKLKEAGQINASDRVLLDFYLQKNRESPF